MKKFIIAALVATVAFTACTSVGNSEATTTTTDSTTIVADSTHATVDTTATK